MLPARRADPFQFLDRARQPGMFVVADIELVPANSVSVYTSRQRETKMADGQRLNQRARSQMELGDDVIVVLAFGTQFLDAADYAIVRSVNASSEQQLDAAFSF